jgi:hypothetical protein
VAQQGAGQALVQALEGHGLGQGHQVGQAVGEDAEDELAETCVDHPAVETAGLSTTSSVGSVVAPWATIRLWPNRQEVEATHSSPGPTR